MFARPKTWTELFRLQIAPVLHSVASTIGVLVLAIAEIVVEELGPGIREKQEEIRAVVMLHFDRSRLVVGAGPVGRDPSELRGLGDEALFWNGRLRKRSRGDDAGVRIWFLFEQSGSLAQLRSGQVVVTIVGRQFHSVTAQISQLDDVGANLPLNINAVLLGVSGNQAPRIAGDSRTKPSQRTERTAGGQHDATRKRIAERAGWR